MQSEAHSSKPLHVTHVVYSFGVGGLEQIIKNTIKTMPKEIRHSIVCLTAADQIFLKSIVDSVETVELNSLVGKRMLTFIDMYKALKRLKPDVLHTYNLATIEFQLLGFLLRIPCRLHAEHGRDLADPDGTNAKYILWRRVFSTFTHFHVAVSNDLYKWLISRVKIPIAKAKLIYNGVDTTKFSPSSEKCKDKDALIKFGHVARLDGIKNQSALINAFLKACDMSTEFSDKCRLLIVGDGGERDNLSKLVEQSKFIDCVEMWGERSDMPAIYQQFDVFVLSSNAEGTPMSILEAMASGLPILSTDVGGIPEIVDTTCAHLVPPQDIDALCNGFLDFFRNNLERLQMGANARELVGRRFSQEKMNNEYLSIYKSRNKKCAV